MKTLNSNFSENYSNRNQNEIQSVYFGNNTFSVLTACAFYSNQAAIEKVPITITTETRDKSRITSVSRVVSLMKYLRSQLDKEFDTVHIFSNGCTAQFRSRYVFCMLREIQKDVNIT